MKDIVRLAFVLTAITVSAALLLSLVEAVTREPIAEQRRQLTLKALGAVLPPFDNAPDEETLTMVVGVDRKGQEVGRTFYRGRAEGVLTGVAFEVVAPDGYSGNIHIMVGVHPGGAVNGIEILTHAETPGLGDKIELPWFKDQFAGQTLEGVDWRVKKDGGDFDQITGATVSPRAIVGAVREGLRFYHQHREQIVYVVIEEEALEEDVDEEPAVEEPAVDEDPAEEDAAEEDAAEEDAAEEDAAEEDAAEEDATEEDATEEVAEGDLLENQTDQVDQADHADGSGGEEDRAEEEATGEE
jgi:Na+-translocating ferredoxin:NAD+ oxidoreductase subunit G